MILEKSAGAIVFRKEKELLFLLICNNGKWDFPKGNVEKDEKEVEAAKREVEEETGIKDLKIIPGFREVIGYYYKRGGKLVSKSVVFYLGVTKIDSVRISFEHEDHKWVNYNDALALLSHDNSKKIIKKAADVIKKVPSLERWTI